MLIKLMKHEFRATGRIMLPLFLIVLLTAVGANISTRTLLEMDNPFMGTLGVLLLTAFTIAIIAVAIIAFLLMVQRFYKNLLQDEGYVMMTLPVSIHHQVWSKLLVSMIWYIATAVVICGAFCILLFNIDFAAECLQTLGMLFEEYYITEEVLQVLAVLGELLLLLFVGTAGGCLTIYASMAIGHSFSSYKVVWSIVIYFGINFALQFISSILMIALYSFDMFGLITVMEQGGIAALHGMMFTMILSQVVFDAVFYFVTVYFMSKRLNLE